MESTWEIIVRLVPGAIWDTLYMVFASGFLALLFGIPLGVILFVTSRGQFLENRKVENVLGSIVNVVRSFPFAILLIALIPFTRLLVGTSLGTSASIVPLTIAATPYIARLVESSFQGVSSSLIEASIVMGSTPWQIIQKVLIPEALPSIITNYTTALINLVGYSAMAGLVGGGGLGTVAIQYGYQRFNGLIMFITVVLLILIVQGIQWLGNKATCVLLMKRGLK